MAAVSRAGAHRVFRSIYSDHETDYEGDATELRLAGDLNAVSPLF